MHTVTEPTEAVLQLTIVPYLQPQASVSSVNLPLRIVRDGVTVPGA